MRKSVIFSIAILSAISLTAFGYMNWNSAVAEPEAPACRSAVEFLPPIFDLPPNVEPIYKVAPRFMHTLTKEELQQARSLTDLLPENEQETILALRKGKVTLLGADGEQEQSERGEGDLFNEAQLKLLQSAAYSTDFYVEADYTRQLTGYMSANESHLIYYFTVVPEQEAHYPGGRAALAAYLREHSQAQSAGILRDQLQPGRLRFTVTRQGGTAGAELESTSGYPALDRAMLDLIGDLPEKWLPARDAKGNAVEQELVVFFGVEGC